MWITSTGILMRVLFQIFKLPFPDHYSIISLSPQYNTTKAFEVIYQKTLNLENYSHTSICHVFFSCPSFYRVI